MDLLCVSFNLQIPGKFLSLFVCNFKTRKFRQASSELDSVCSDVAGVQHFVLACLQILIHAGSMPPYLPPSLVLETPLSLEIQSSARVSCSEQRDAKLFLSSWSLKTRYSQCIPVSSEFILRRADFPSEMLIWQPVSSTIAGVIPVLY